MMTDARVHTPGPWVRGHMGDAKRFWIGPSYKCVVAIVDRDLEPDARLIASAPALQAHADALAAELVWLEAFAAVRSGDDSKTFARVNRGALRTIRDRAGQALAAYQATKP